MKMILAAAAAAATTALLGGTASAKSVPNGKVSVADLYVPTVTFAGGTGTYSTGPSGLTFEVEGTQGLSSVTGLNGKMDGSLTFSTTVGVTTDEAVSDFFTFNDGHGGNYDFSVASVQDKTISLSSDGSSNSGSLFLLGMTTDSTLGLSATPTSLTLSFNSTDSSPYSSSATLSIPPVGSAPEPSAWILMIAGVGLAGAAFRRSRLVRASQTA